MLKLGDFIDSPDLPMKKNLESIINYSHSRSMTDLSAIIIAVNAFDESILEFMGEMVKG